jgi:hypothetical protein
MLKRLILLLSLILVGVSPAYAGAVIVDGTDANSHGQATGGANQDGWLYMQKVLENLASQVPPGAAKVVVNIGANSDYSNLAINSAFNLSTLPGNGWTLVHKTNAADIAAWLDNLSPANTGILAISTFGETPGDITQDEMDVINARAVKLANFVNGLNDPSQGGALWSMTETGGDFGGTGGYNWLQALIPGLNVITSGGDTSITLTPDGMAAFPNLTDQQIAGNHPWHQHFEGDFGGLKILGVAPLFPGDTDRNVILGGGAGTVIDTCTKDTQAPTLTCQDILIQCPGVVNYPLPTATDNCSTAVTVECAPPPGTTFPLGPTVVNCIATDESENIARCTFQVVVQDTTPPVITSCSSAPITLPVTAGACTATLGDLTGGVVATDNCSPNSALIKTQIPAVGTALAAGQTHPVTVTVMDPAGRSSSCVMMVTVPTAPAPTAVISPPTVQLGSVKLFGKVKKKKKAKPLATTSTGTFTISNPGCATLSVSLKGISRVTDAGSLSNTDDRAFFSVFKEGETIDRVGQTVTISGSGEQRFVVEFHPTVPPTSTIAGRSASNILPNDFMSRLVINDGTGDKEIRLHAGADVGVKLIDPNDPAGSASAVTVCRSGDIFTVTYFVYDSSKADIKTVTYDFLDSSDKVLKTVSNVDLGGAISNSSLLNGQSFKVDHDFSGAGDNSSVAKVRVTVAASNSASATSSGISSSCGAGTQSLWQSHGASVVLPAIRLEESRP